MKELTNKNTELIQRVNWLMINRWYAVIGVIIVSVVAKFLIKIDISLINIMSATLLLVAENIIGLYYIKKIISEKDKTKQYHRLKRNINCQISFDLIVLTILIHYLGGIESPFLLAFFFHIPGASILLSKRETVIQTSLAVLLISMLTFFEFYDILPHHCFCIKKANVTIPDLYSDIYYVYKALGAFIISLYILIYISTSIGTRLRNQEDQYEEAILKLNKKDELKNEYVLRLTHDIKGHISAIQSSLSVVKTGVFAEIDPRNQEFINRAYRRTYALIKFIKDLLRLTKMRQGDDFERKTFSFKDMLYECVKEVESNAETKSIEIISKIDEKIDTITGDGFSLKEITSNMMLNAVKYTPVNGKICLEAYDYVDFIRIIISDSGIGVPEEDIPHIFEEFYRGSNVDKKKIEGTGVGLAIAKNVIKQHKGDIWVENNPTGGTKFIYDIPKI